MYDHITTIVAISVHCSSGGLECANKAQGLYTSISIRSLKALGRAIPFRTRALLEI